jgi:hypothetical protein
MFLKSVMSFECRYHSSASDGRSSWPPIILTLTYSGDSCSNLDRTVGWVLALCVTSTVSCVLALCVISTVGCVLALCVTSTVSCVLAL